MTTLTGWVCAGFLAGCTAVFFWKIFSQGGIQSAEKLDELVMKETRENLKDITFDKEDLEKWNK